MKTRTIGYWVATGLTGLAIGGSGVLDATGVPQAATELARLGYPAYFGIIIGVWKVFAATAILAPGFPRLKEWAYAGIVFDLTGAAASYVFTGTPAQMVAPLIVLAIATTSWALRPESRKLRSPDADATGDMRAPAGIHAPRT